MSRLLRWVAISAVSILVGGACLFGMYSCMANQTVAVPDVVPDDFPLYATGALRGASSTTEGAGSGADLKIETADPVETVLAGYTAQLAAAGWQPVPRGGAGGGMAVISFSKSTWHGEVVIQRRDDVTILDVSMVAPGSP